VGGALPPERYGRFPVTPSPQAPLLPGRLRERYRTGALLRSSGTAEVWAAVDEKLNRMVAVYLMPSAEAGAAGLLRAARAAATVPDTRFLQVLDAIEDGGNTYVVTEWPVDAEPVAALLARGPLPVRAAVRLVTEVAEALASAHTLGQPHVRIDPDTVLRTPSDQIKVQGLRIEAALAGLDGVDHVDAEDADVRALGALLYAALTGFWPFGSGYGLPPAPLDGGVLRSPTVLTPGVPAELSSLTLRLLTPRDPAEATPYGCRQVADDLMHLARSAPALRGPAARVERPAAPTPTTATATWGEPVTAPRTPAPPGGPGRPESRPAATAPPAWRKLALPAVIILLVAGGLGLLGNKALSGLRPQTTPSASPSNSTTSEPDADPVALTISSAHLWQSGVEDEHGDEVADTITGSGDGWSTFSYADGPEMLLKPGTGIIYDLGSVQTVRSATVQIGAAGATLEMRAAPTSLDAVPAVVAGQAPPGFLVMATVPDAPTTVQLTAAQPVRTRFVLIWFTALPERPLDNWHHFPYYDSILHVRIFG
jgi:hypothetical protein